MRKYLSIEQVSQMMGDPNRVQSLAELVAFLTPEDQQKYFGEILNAEETLYDWNFWGRPKQIIPETPYYNVHLLLAGRGFGKTRAMAEFVRAKAMSRPGIRIGILGRSAADTRDVMVTGESGVLNIPQPESEKPVYKPSEAAVYWPNGSVAKMMSAESPDAVRGQQFDYAVVDEFAAHTQYVGADGLTAFENLRLATRLSEHPIIVVATTPKRMKALRKLVDEAQDPTKSIRVVNGKTSENSSNLSNTYMDIIHGAFDGTAVAKQELDGEMLDEDPEGALWKDGMIRHIPMTFDEAMRLPLRVVAVDPTVAESPGDECGIVVVGATAERLMHKRKGYVLADESLKASPEVWAQKVIDTAKKWNAHGIVVEKNQGHHLLTMALRNIDANIAIYPVSAGQSKKLRAEPVAQIYEQGRIKHMSPGFSLLEDQQVTWEPEVTKKSPDRIDALVHGITAVMIAEPEGLRRRKLRAKNLGAGHRLPDGIGTGRVRSRGI